MEFLALFLPFALLVDAAWFLLYLRDRRLVHLLRERHPGVFDELRGRPRRWYDPSETLWIQQRDVRRRLRPLIASRAADDPVLAEALADVDVRERWLRISVWIGVALTIPFVLGVVLYFRLSTGR